MTEQGPSGRDPKPALSSLVAWAPGGFAYVPGRAIVRGREAAEHLRRVAGGGSEGARLDRRDVPEERAWVLVEGVEDPVRAVAAVRADGFEAQPDHVFFAHADGCCCGPHPAHTFDAYEAHPYRANPYRANPYRANSYRANPYRANPYRANEAQTSSAVPATGRGFPERALTGPGRHPRITVLDTGLPEDPQRPPLLDDARFTGTPELPDAFLTGSGGATTPPDAWLDPVAGHGAFIAGLIEQLAPGCTVHVEHVIGPLGDARESAVLQAIVDQALGDPPDILSLSFGGTALAMAPALRSAVAFAQMQGIVVVASAGNDASCEPQYPAAYPDVVAVGALCPDGPAPFTNYGDWVDACAPGTDLVSAFFDRFDGPMPEVNGVDADRFNGWACWSGTSFAAPVVVAALAREMVLGGVDARTAVRQLIHAPASLRLRGLGTVVNA